MTELLTVISQFGPLGVIVWVLWNELREFKRSHSRDDFASSIQKIADIMENLAKEQSHMKDRLDEVARMNTEMFKMHDVRDEDGVPLWYVRRSLESAITRLSTNIEMQTKVLERIGIQQETLCKLMQAQVKI